MDDRVQARGYLVGRVVADVYRTVDGGTVVAFSDGTEIGMEGEMELYLPGRGLPAAAVVGSLSDWGL